MGATAAVAICAAASRECGDARGDIAVAATAGEREADLEERALTTNGDGAADECGDRSEAAASTSSSSSSPRMRDLGCESDRERETNEPREKDCIG